MPRGSACSCANLEYDIASATGHLSGNFTFFAAVSRPSVWLKADLMLVPRDYKIARTYFKRELWGAREQGGANTSSATSMNTVQGLLLVSLPLHSVSLSSRALKPKCPRICTLRQNTGYIHTRNSWYYPGRLLRRLCNARSHSVTISFPIEKMPIRQRS